MLQFISTSPSEIKAALVADYQARTGKVLQPAHLEQLVFDSIAYVMSLHKEQINFAANQNLVEFSRAPMLDYLGQLVGVERLPPAPATALFNFVFEPSHPALIIPAGFRMNSTDGQMTFQLEEDLVVQEAAGAAEGVELVCTTEGTDGNGYLSGDVSVIIDPQPFLISCENFTTTQGGVDTETDEALRARIKLAPDSFSTAGSRGAYTYHSRTFSQDIIDVTVTTPTPGTVNIYPLLTGGAIPNSTVRSNLQAYLSGEKIRPLTDTVVVLAPTVVNYSIQVNVTRKSTADATDTQAAVLAALTAFADERKNKLGLDALLVQITGVVQGVTGVYSSSIVTPGADVTVTDTQVALCTGITVNIVGAA